jgi:hypothetical protein
MQTCYLIAAVLALVTGVIHSLLGERLIFRHLRLGGLVPALAAPPLQARHIRILWATWHLATIFGWAFAGVLLHWALGEDKPDTIVANAVAFAYLGGAVLVLIGTRGRHPGWLALALVAALVWVGTNRL